MCSVLCSSDVFATISLIRYDKMPNLFSIVFGEGITNRAVSIILFNTVLKYTTSDTEISPSIIFPILENFCGLGLKSVLIGIIFGLLSAYIMAKYRAFSKNPV